MVDYISEMLGILGLAFAAGMYVSQIKINNKNLEKLENKVDDNAEEQQAINTKILEKLHDISLDTAVLKSKQVDIQSKQVDIQSKQVDIQNQIAKATNQPASYM